MIGDNSREVFFLFFGAVPDAFVDAGSSFGAGGKLMGFEFGSQKYMYSFTYITITTLESIVNTLGRQESWTAFS